MIDGGQESEAEDSINDPAGNVEQGIPPKKGGVSRLLILLLLVVGAGAGFYLFGQDLFVPELPVAQQKSHAPNKIKMPARPQPVEPSEGVKEEVVSLEEVAAVVAPPAAAVKVIPSTVPSFALTSGGFLYKNSLNQAKTHIEKLGYKVDSSQTMEPHEMTRLLVGLYDRSSAEKRLAEVKKRSDGAFIAAEEGKYAVYAGSFISLDKARRLADILYQEGIRVDERQMMVNLSITTLRFGEFVDRSDAQKVIKKLDKLGVKKLQIVPYK